MEKIKIIWLTFVLFLLPAYAHSSTLGDLRLSLMDGDVQVKIEDNDWIPASVNMPLRAGDRIWVPDGSRAELQLRGGTFLRLDEKSSLDILVDERDSSQFYLAEGHAYVNFRGARDSVIQLDTPISSARAYDRAKFRVDIYRDGGTEISVFNGTVYAESRSGKTKVASGNTLFLSEDSYGEISPLGRADEWEKWNVGRDRRLEDRRYSNRYLPDELESYSSDFDDNGKWVYTGEYGYVWTPTIYVSAGWAPYRQGRWVWVGGDYVWIGYEPWGWAPYHYGRWTFVASIGWCWVPPVRGQVYWGPGFVGWVSTPTYVAWVPLAPGEIYYGHGYYGPNSVNIVNVNVNKITVKNVYRNVYVNNAVTTVHQDTFVKGKHMDFKVKENPFLTEKVSIGRPMIKPEKTSIMPVIKEIPQAKRPPTLVRDIRVKEIKEKHPLVKERKGSALSPEAPSKPMPIKRFEQPKGKEPRIPVEKEFVPSKRIQPTEKEEKDKKKSKELRPVPDEKRKEQPEEAIETQPVPKKKLKQQKPEKEQEPGGPPKEIKRDTKKPSAEPDIKSEKNAPKKDKKEGKKEDKEKKRDQEEKDKKETDIR